MSDTVDTKLSGKMLFGIDYLNIMFFTQWNNEHEKYDWFSYDKAIKNL